MDPHSHHIRTIVYFIIHHTLFWFGYSVNEVVTWASWVVNMVMWVALIKSGPPLLSTVAFKLWFISFITHWLKLVGFTRDVAPPSRWSYQTTQIPFLNFVNAIKDCELFLVHADSISHFGSSPWFGIFYISWSLLLCSESKGGTSACNIVIVFLSIVNKRLWRQFLCGIYGCLDRVYSTLVR